METLSGRLGIAINPSGDSSLSLCQSHYACVQWLSKQEKTYQTVTCKVCGVKRKHEHRPSSIGGNCQGTTGKKKTLGAQHIWIDFRMWWLPNWSSIKALYTGKAILNDRQVLFPGEYSKFWRLQLMKTVFLIASSGSAKHIFSVFSFSVPMLNVAVHSMCNWQMWWSVVELIWILNHLGVMRHLTPWRDTYTAYQKNGNKLGLKGCLLVEKEFTVTSDNIDFLSSYTAVYSVCQHRSCQVTSVQPRPQSCAYQSHPKLVTQIEHKHADQPLEIPTPLTVADVPVHTQPIAAGFGLNVVT